MQAGLMNTYQHPVSSRQTVAWFLSSGRPGDDSPPANYLPARYARPDTTPLHAVS